MSEKDTRPTRPKRYEYGGFAVRRVPAGRSSPGFISIRCLSHGAGRACPSGSLLPSTKATGRSALVGAAIPPGGLGGIVSAKYLRLSGSPGGWRAGWRTGLAAGHTPDGAKRRRSVPLEGSPARHPPMGLAEAGTAVLYSRWGGDGHRGETLSFCHLR